MKQLLLSGIVASFIAGPALSADIPVKAPPIVSCIWCGDYVGGNIGYGFGKASATGDTFYTGNLGGAAGTTGVWSLSDNLTGVLGAIQVGRNTQINSKLTLVIELDFQGSGLSSAGNAATPLTVAGANGLQSHSGVATSSERLDWFGTVRGRLGVTPFSRETLLYATGGIAFGHSRGTLSYSEVFPGIPATIVGAGQFSTTRLGWTAGVGVEWAPAAVRAWTFKVEYLYTDLGGMEARVPVNTLPIGPAGFPTFVASQSSQNRFNTIRAGVNYHFN